MSAADRRKYRKPHIADDGRDYDNKDAEIERLRAELACCVKNLITVVRMPNVEHVADAHNEAVKRLRALAAKGE